MKSGGRVIPISCPFPISVLELVLNVEEPDSAGAADSHSGQLDQEPGKKAVNSDENGSEREDREIDPKNRTAIPLASTLRREALTDQEKVERAYE